MLFNTQSQKVLSLLKDIGEKAIFTYPVTGIQDTTKSILAFIDFSKLENPEFPEFGLIKIKEFLELSKIVSEESAEITLDNNIITMKGDGVSCRYITTDVSVLEGVRTGTKILDLINSLTPSADFLLDNKTIDKMKKVSALLNLDDMVIDISEGVKILVSDKDSDDNMTIDIPVSIVNGEHRINISIVNLKKLPAGDYNCQVLKHPTAPDSYVVYLKPTNLEALSIVLATKAVKQDA